MFEVPSTALAASQESKGQHHSPLVKRLPFFPVGDIRVLPFQVGDLVTRGLLAVSQLAQLGAGIWFGPGPVFIIKYIYIDRNPKIIDH